ncbi:hypothetical protein [Streptomyces sp. NPDC058330]|uniref:hypothetical protein n=1 Tax=Streptomyces sp. NPDC058330 TaxID=3346449 RepID=UPI0036F10AA5
MVDESEEVIEIRPEPDASLLLVPVPEGKASEYRLHHDFHPDQDTEVARPWRSQVRV